MTRKASLSLVLGAALAGGLVRGTPLTTAAIADLSGEPVEPLSPPDHLSVDRDSPYYDECYKRIGVRLDGIERRGDVQEYCMSEGWILVRDRNAIGKFKIDNQGRYMFTKLFGAVVAYWKDNRPTRRFVPNYTQPPEAAKAALSAAEAKRQRKAAKALRDAGRVV